MCFYAKFGPMAELCFYKKIFPWIKAKREKIFKCDLCSLNFVFQKDMLDHFVSNHKTNTCYGCSFCEVLSEDSDFLLMHMQTLHLAFIYLCMKCDFQCTSKQEMLQHAESHTNTMSKEQSTLLSSKTFIERRCLSCSICTRIFSQPSLLRRHVVYHHSGGSNKSCDNDRGETGVQEIEMENDVVYCIDEFTSVTHVKGRLEIESKVDVQSDGNPSSRDDREVISVVNASDREHSPRPLHFFCIFCLKRFRNKNLLESHERTHSNDIDPQLRLEMLCEFCDETFKGAEKLRVHQKHCNGNNNKLQKFPSLSTSLSSGKDTIKVESHLSLKGGEDVLHDVRAQVSVGPSDNDDSDDFRDALHPVRRSTACDEKFRFDDKRQGASSYVCHYCRKGFRSKIKFLDHYFEHDKTVKSFSCATCDARFGYSSSMPKHVEMHRRDLGLFGPKPLANLCPKCGKHYRDRASLKRHEAMVHLKVGHPCHDCQKTFSSAQALRQHARQHTGEFIYQCDLCPKKYANPSSLHNHKKTHSENKLACNLCSKSFALKHHLARHLARHVGFPINGQKS